MLHLKKTFFLTSHSLTLILNCIQSMTNKTPMEKTITAQSSNSMPLKKPTTFSIL